MKTYYGDSVSHIVSINGNEILPLYPNLVNHSPDGFSWGYSGSGPSQLAFAILYNYTDNLEFSKNNYFNFRDEVISKFNMKGTFILNTDSIKEWILYNT